jgi:hypothetical protein
MKLNRPKFALKIVLGATVLGASTIHGAPVRAQSAPTLSIRDVQTVFHRRAQGNEYFTARLRAELVQQGLQFVRSSSHADAILDTYGQYNGRAFVGRMTFTDKRGRVIWSENVYRPDNSRVMAYNRLADRLRARRR